MTENSFPDTFHRTALRVPLYEVDIGQGVYHGNYFHFFEQGRERFFRDIGFSYRQLMDQGLHLTVAELSCVYKTSLRYNDKIDILTGISWLRRRSLGLVHRIHRNESGQSPVLCTEAVISMVCVRSYGGPVLLPEDFVECLRGFIHTALGPKKGK